jgi:biotin synthase
MLSCVVLKCRLEVDEMGKLRPTIDRLRREGKLSHDEYVFLLRGKNDEDTEYLRSLAQETAVGQYGRDIFLRGLIEFTNYCRNDCYYCGIRRSNSRAERYRLTEDQILECCETGYGFGLRTFVLQGGEDMYFDDDRMCRIISAIRCRFPDCAITLSIGEREKESYRRFYEAGADRYLLRHETASEEHYRRLHPPELSAEHRKQCLLDLKDIGFQIGAGFMVGSPYQTLDDLASDFEYLKELEPHMIGIGPFIHHKDTPFRDMPDGTLEMTLYCLSILRLMFPKVLLPATTALGTIHPLGRELGVKAGANVIMPSLSPKSVRGKYMLYDGKICTGEEAAECHACLERRMESIGYKVVSSRGDYAGWSRK